MYIIILYTDVLTFHKIYFNYNLIWYTEKNGDLKTVTSTLREREVVCGQVWWPILGICSLHLTHPSAHSQQWTHTWSSGQPYCGARGAVGGSVPCSRVSPQSWYWRWREHLLFTPPTDNPCRTWESNRQPLGYKSNSLTIRPRLPLY